MRSLAFAIGGGVLGLALLGACSLDRFGGRDGIVDGGSDATVDAAVDAASDAEPDAADGGAAADACASALFCGAACAPAPTCTGCDAGPLVCGATTPRTCANDCALGCAGRPIACFSCAVTATGGTCEPAGSAYCLTTDYVRCGCAKADPTTCPLDTHVCVDLPDGGAECRTCGEDQTDGKPCKGGLKCAAPPGGGAPPACTK